MQNALAIRETHTAITRLENVAEIRQTWIDSKRQELALAEEAVKALRVTHGVTTFRYKRAVARRHLLKKVVRAMERGFVPIPRFDARSLVSVEELPVSALIALKEAEATKVFDEIRFVAGRESDNRRGPQRRLAARDPLLIGIVRHPTIEGVEGLVPGRGYVRERDPGREEHFLIAWWRPEDERDEVMF